MTINIHIEAHPDRGDMKDQLDQSMRALGFYRAASDEIMHRNLVEPVGTGSAYRTGPAQPQGEPATSNAAPEPKADAPAAELATRQIGDPSEGNKRRNSAEKAEDDVFEKLSAAKGIPIEKINEAIAKGGRKETLRQLGRMPDADAPAISTGENRAGPEDDPETEAQDAADEAAEVEASRNEEAPLTVDDVKAAVAEYVAKFEMDAAMNDGVKIFEDALGKPPAGNEYWKMSLLAGADQKLLGKAVAAWKAAAKADERYGGGV